MRLTVEGLKKSFDRRKVLNDVSFSVSRGEVVGFVGPNGAGKSTTMKIVLGLVKPDSGNIRIDDASLKAQRSAYLNSIAGFVDAPPLYPILNAIDHLKYVARLRGINSKEAVAETLLLVGLAPDSNKAVSRFSMGMKQRLAIGMTLIQKPQFLVLDEPINGLDPAAIIQFRLLIRRLADEHNVGVLVSSHILSEVERICDRVIFIRSGAIIRTVEPRRQGELLQVSVRTTNNNEAAALLGNTFGMESVLVRDESITVSVPPDSLVSIANLLVEKGLGILELSPAKRNLETEYLSEFRHKEMLS